MHLKFVQTQQVRILLDKRARDMRQRIAAQLLKFDLVHFLVDAEHEGVKVNALLALRGDRGRVEEEVHQHGLAAS
jgi:hypothetical protein